MATNVAAWNRTHSGALHLCESGVWTQLNGSPAQVSQGCSQGVSCTELLSGAQWCLLRSHGCWQTPAPCGCRTVVPVSSWPPHQQFTPQTLLQVRRRVSLFKAFTWLSLAYPLDELKNNWHEILFTSAKPLHFCHVLLSKSKSRSPPLSGRGHGRGSP